MGINVIVAPGVAGSVLYDTAQKRRLFGTQATSPRAVYGQVAGQGISGALAGLALDANGNGLPTVEPRGLIGAYYQKMVRDFQGAGFNVLQLDYDWRKGLWSLAPQQWQRILAWLPPGEGFYWVGHSMGTQLARALHRYSASSPLWKHAFFVGAPNNGSPDAVQTFLGIGSMYVSLASLTLVGYLLKPTLGPLHSVAKVSALVRNGWNVSTGNRIIAPLDAVLYTFDGMASLMPNDPEFWDSSWWAGHGVPIQQAMLDRAFADRKEVIKPGNAIPDSKVVWVTGTGQNTAAYLADKKRPRDSRSYVTTLEGDGRVTEKNGSFIGHAGQSFGQVHGDLMIDPRVILYVITQINALEATGSLTQSVPLNNVSSLPPGTPPQAGPVLNQAPPMVPFASPPTSVGYPGACPKVKPAMAGRGFLVHSQRV